MRLRQRAKMLWQAAANLLFAARIGPPTALKS